MASGDVLAVFYPADNEPPTANYATRDHRNNRPVLDFDGGSTDEFAVFSGVMPQHYDNTTGVTVYFYWSADGTASGNVVWGVDFERTADDAYDIDSDGFTGTPQTVQDAAPTVDGEVTVANVAVTKGAQMDSVVAGDLYRIKVNRDASDTTNDTIAADCELHAVEIRET